MLNNFIIKYRDLLHIYINISFHKNVNDRKIF